MQQSLVMSVTTLERTCVVANALESLRRAWVGAGGRVRRSRPRTALKRLELQVGPMPGLADPANAAGPNMIRADGAAHGRSPTSAAVARAARSERGLSRRDQGALIDAMLEHSRGMNIQPDEWLTVAAHRGESPLGPSEIVNSSTLVLRIKGSDLALYDADRTARPKSGKRVESREF
jgi:hypothetical protein